MENNTSKNPDALEEFEREVRAIHSQIEKENEKVFAKYPLLFSLLVTFGAVAVIHGFEGIVDSMPFIGEHPIVLFIAGLILLLFTGRLYKSLGK